MQFYAAPVEPLPPPTPAEGHRAELLFGLVERHLEDDTAKALDLFKNLVRG